MLSKAEGGARRISVVVDEAATERELSSSFVVGHVTSVGAVGIFIQFIGPEGRVLETVSGAEASYSVSDGYSYVRAKVIYTRKVENGYENFYAWMQPVFTDGRTHFVK
jgi:hypothetical protein